MMEVLQECPICHLMKSDVDERQDHYAQEINNEEGAMMVCCASCEHEKFNGYMKVESPEQRQQRLDIYLLKVARASQGYPGDLGELYEQAVEKFNKENPI